MGTLYMKMFGGEIDDDLCQVPLTSLIVTFVSQWTIRHRASASRQCDDDDDGRVGENVDLLDVVLVKGTTSSSTLNDGHEASFDIPPCALSQFRPKVVQSPDDLPSTVQMCALPAIVTDGGRRTSCCVSGLCGVLRHVLRSASRDDATGLLGFRKGCLMACAEVSVWTKFCEVDLVKSTNEFLINSENDRSVVRMPNDLSRFEGHMRHPLRTHNIGKKEHAFVKRFNRRLILLDEGGGGGQCCDAKSRPAASGESSSSSFLPHDYAEDVTMTLSDLVILICLHQMFIGSGVSWSLFDRTFPSSMSWYRRMTSDDRVKAAMLCCGMTPFSASSIATTPIDRRQMSASPVCRESLYKRDVKRYNPSARIYTKQIEVQAIVDKLRMSSIIPEYSKDDLLEKKWIDWDDLPKEVHPTFVIRKWFIRKYPFLKLIWDIGDMPKIRLERKCQQLDNMAKAICSVASDGNTIVDFCSGGGHLGLLLAYLLPSCRVFMIDNKESSVDRAARRATTLPNATVIQCNLDYFRGKFDVGVALHACGVATDLVLQRCIDVGASFVVCPCCYGGVVDTHSVSYPRSDKYRRLGITSQEYYYLAHAADQTHENGHKNDQGNYCMGLVDTDRRFDAESTGYAVSFRKMNPTNCTPKNNILLGVKVQR